MFTAAIVGCGPRAWCSFGQYALEHPDQVKVTALVDPDPHRLAQFGERHGLSRNRYSSVEQLLDSGDRTDFIVNMSSDRVHHLTTIPLLEAGNIVLLDKPIASTMEQCIEMAHAAKADPDSHLEIFLEMPYTAVYKHVLSILCSGELGDILSIDHKEQVGRSHFIHSFVRGHWNNMATSGPITVTKSSHDADILLRMMGRIPRVISGHAEPLYYAERNAPQGSAERCSDCQAPCFYDAAEFYQLDIANDLPQALSLTHDPQEIQAALRQGRFGRCIYRCDNNVPDSLVVVYHYPDARVRFEMEGHSPRETRITKITGTKGILEADMLAGWITINGAVRNNWKIVDPHCYGDQALISRFLHNLEHGTWDQKRLDETLVSHALAFASQRAIEKGMISFPSYLESQGAKLFLHNTSYI